MTPDVGGDDITKWSVDKLDELGLLAYHNVEGVEVVDGDGGDPIGPHGINRPGETD